MAELVTVPAATWTELPIIKSGIIRHKSGGGQVLYAQSSATPSNDFANVQLFEESILDEKIPVNGMLDGYKVFAYAVSSTCKLSVTNIESNSVPDGVFSGLRAQNVQFYTESNKKLGTQWEASRSIPLAAVGTKVYSLIVVGTKTVDLKGRVLGGTGAGVYGRHYKIQPSDVTVDLQDADPWFNFRTSYFGTQPETKLYAGTNIIYNTVSGTAAELAVSDNKVFADINAITNTQNQAAGVVPQTFGSNHILEPGDYILLEIESYDASQIGTAGLEIYEGDLDLPLS